MVWEAVFMLVVLKIPIVYLCFVVWWAIRAEPRPEEPAALVPALADTPPVRPPGRGGRPGRGSGRGGPTRRPSRTPGARARARR